MPLNNLPNLLNFTCLILKFFVLTKTGLIYNAITCVIIKKEKYNLVTVWQCQNNLKSKTLDSLLPTCLHVFSVNLVCESYAKSERDF